MKEVHDPKHARPCSGPLRRGLPPVPTPGLTAAVSSLPGVLPAPESHRRLSRATAFRVCCVHTRDAFESPPCGRLSAGHPPPVAEASARVCECYLWTYFYHQPTDKEDPVSITKKQKKQFGKQTLGDRFLHLPERRVLHRALLMAMPPETEVLELCLKR